MEEFTSSPGAYLRTGRGLSTFFLEITVLVEDGFKRAQRRGKYLMDFSPVVDRMKMFTDVDKCLLVFSV